MVEANDPWRDKYRKALTQKEQTLAAQQSILQLAITVLTNAAEGHDGDLDERLQAIRASAKQNDTAGFDRMLKSLPRVTEEVSERQQRQWRDIHKILTIIVTQVQQQSPAPDIKSGVKDFKKQLPKGPLMPATLKQVLQQLSSLHRQALNNGTQNPEGLLSKLFKGKTAEENEVASENDPTTLSVTDEEAKPRAIDNTDISTERSVLSETLEDCSDDHNRALPEVALPEVALQNTQAETTTPEVPERVSVILIELLDHFKSIPASEHKATKARQRIGQGLKWFELAPTLEDIRDFVLQAYVFVDDDYRGYLQELNGELSDLLAALGISIETEQRARQAADQLHVCINDGVTHMHQALAEHDNINQLKQVVESHMQQLQSALAQFKQNSTESPDNESLTVQLQTLAAKVQQMEQNEENIRHRLEEEKQRAVTDSLTGLPNREAYGEKIYEEMQRWQRYQHSLTLAVLDIDFFKKINDTYGHQTGDKVLKFVANTVLKRLREVDFMARYGGEEFVLVLPETNVENALMTLNRIRDTLANAPLRYKEEKITVTVSIGIAGFNEGDDSETVFARADKALYDAKETGRNKCCVG